MCLVLAEAGPLDLEGPPLPSVQGSPPAPRVGPRTVRGPANDAILSEFVSENCLMLKHQWFL